MRGGEKGMGMKKHARSGRSPKSPKMRAALKREAERNEVKDRSRIADPKGAVSDLFKSPK